MKILPALVAGLGLTGCMQAAQAPSLQPRAIEIRGEAVDSAPSPPAVKPLDTSLRARIAALLAEASRGDDVFAKADASNANAIKGGRRAATGSEAWIAGEQGRSALEAARQQSAAALTEIDALVIAQASAIASDPSIGGLPELQAAQSAIEAMVSRQSARIDALIR